MVQVFGTPQLVLASGHGCWVTDVDGKRYLDLLVRHRRQRARPRPPRARAGGRQAGRVGDPRLQLLHLRAGDPARRAAAVDRRRPRAARASSSPTPAPRRPRRRSSSRVAPGARASWPWRASFHGRSTGALALTHKAAYREPFEPLIPEVVFVPPNDADALRAAVDDTTAALFVEPIQGEAGVRELSADYLRLARELTSAHGALLVVDEIQTGDRPHRRLVRPPGRRASCPTR